MPQSRFRHALSSVTELIIGGVIPLDIVQSWWDDILWVACNDVNIRFISIRTIPDQRLLCAEAGDREPTRETGFSIPRKSGSKETSRPSCIKSLPLSEEEAFHRLIMKKVERAGRMIAVDTSSRYGRFRDECRGFEYIVNVHIHRVDHHRIYVCDLNRVNLQ